MPATEKKILRGVRVGGRTYTPGQEDELEEALTSEEAKRLTDKGYLEGKFSGKAKAPKAEEKK
jgi:hypothetical protein